MRKEYEYNGAIARINGNNYIFILRENELITDGICVDGPSETYDNLKEEEFALVFVQLYDGTELMNLEKILIDNNFNEIFFKMVKIGNITVMDGENPMTVSKLIELEQIENFIYKVFADYNNGDNFKTGKTNHVESIIIKN